MDKENALQEKKEEVNHPYLEELRNLKGDLDNQIKTLQELKANEILSGKTTTSDPPEKPKKISPEDYSDAALKGIILKDGNK